MGDACFNVRLYVVAPPERMAELFDTLASIGHRLKEGLGCECVGHYMFACACSEGLLVRTSLAGADSGGASIRMLPSPTTQSAIAVSISSTNASALLKVLETVVKEVRTRGFKVMGFY